MLIRRNTAAGLILCIALLAASIPLLMSIGSFTQESFFGENVYSITPVSNSDPIKLDLAELLENESWIENVSPEVYAFCIVKDQAVVVRGVEPYSFLRIEKATLMEGEIPENFLLAGEGISNRLPLERGQPLVLTGSTSPRIIQLSLSGIFKSSSPSNDELLVSLEDGWRISPVGKGSVLSIRVQTDDYDRLVSFLNGTKIPMVVGDGSTTKVLNTNKTFDSRLATLLFQHPGLGGRKGVAHTSVFIQQAGNSVRAVVLAFIILNSLLIVFGMVAVLARGLIEKRGDMGILSAIGATKGKIRSILLFDLLKISLLASSVGLVFGILLAYLIGSHNLILLFGHGIEPLFSLEMIAMLFLLGMVLSFAICVVIYELLHRKRPLSLILSAEEMEKRRGLEEVLSP